jgi:16S rRNA (guanine966-N2)-methyltransferase
LSSPRIIAGSARGIRLKSVPGTITRPITDRVKEALFNIIGADITDATFWDVFAGTGSVGIEALSRGATYTLFTDINRQAISAIRENLQRTRLTDKAQVLQADALKRLGLPPDRKFDYVFIAPPQYKGIWLSALSALDGNIEWLSDDGWVIVQINPIEFENIKLHNLEIFDQRKYGDTELIFYTLKIDADEEIDQDPKN